MQYLRRGKFDVINMKIYTVHNGIFSFLKNGPYNGNISYIKIAVFFYF